MNNEEAKTQILMNFGPLGGGEIHQQNIYTSAMPQTNDEQKDEPSERKKLSIAQLAILFSNTLDVTFSPRYNNVNAIARLIAEVSGYSQESVRKKLGEIDFGSPQSAKDIERVAELLNDVSPKIAEKIRKNI